MISALGQQLLARSMPPTEIDVIDIDDHISPDQHDTLKQGSVIVIRKSTNKDDGTDIYIAYVIEGKKVGSLIGSVDKKSVVGNDLVVGQAYIVTNDLRSSEKLADKRKSAKHKGMVKAHLISDIIDKQFEKSK